MGKFNVSKDDTKDILTITSNQAGLARTFSEFKKQNPGLIITQIVDSAKDPSSQEITYTFELGKDDSGRINQSLLYIPRADITANSFAESYKRTDNAAKYSFLPIKNILVHNMNDSMGSVVMVEKAEERVNFEGVTVPPTTDINTYLKKHPKVRVVGFKRPTISKKSPTTWNPSPDVYQRGYSVDVILANIDDFPELRAISSQTVLSCTDLPSSPTSKQVSVQLKKRNTQQSNQSQVNQMLSVAQQQVSYGKVNIPQLDEKGTKIVQLTNGGTARMAGKCDVSLVLISDILVQAKDGLDLINAPTFVETPSTPSVQDNSLGEDYIPV